jgi:hypothetical protein
LHLRTGALVDDVFWYEPGYSQDRKLFKPQDWTKLDQLRRRAYRSIQAHGYAEELEELIVRYVVALDNPDFDVAFLQLWSLLEKLTDTVGANYDETIKRTSWLFDDRATVRELLGHLRLRRNRFVHAAKTGDKPDQAVYLAKYIIDGHLDFLIRNQVGFTSMQEYGEFLKLPRDGDTAKRRRYLLTKAIRMHGTKPED